MSEKVTLSAPWMTYYHELEEMFKRDPEIKIVYDEESYTVKLYVAKSAKAEALDKLLKKEVSFGTITLNVIVVPPNEDEVDILDLYEDAFAGNPSLDYTIPIESPLGRHCYVVMKNEVVQFFNDQLDDPHGNKSTLLQEIARDIFIGDPAVHFCTNTKKEVGKPLGEWP